MIKTYSLPQQLAAEYLGTLLLLTIVIGSGIMGQNLSEGNIAIALLANTFATFWGLFILIEMFGPVSGAHFNPVVSCVMAYRKAMNRAFLPGFIVVQLLGAISGAFLAHLMFDLSVFQVSEKIRSSTGLYIAEIVATTGLLFVILMSPKQRVSLCVASYIGAAYWFTASTSFANPAAVFGRMFSNSFAGISPQSAGMFVLAQLLGAVLALILYKIFEDRTDKTL